jgi:type II secretory pathway pseudopilin PulG
VSRFALQGRGRRRFARAFTVLELVVVIVVVGAVGLFGIDRLYYYQELSEKAAMDATLASFKMGLQIRSAEIAISNRASGAGALDRENPVRWLDAPPPNYGGEYRAPAAAGLWYFAPAEAELVYVPNNVRYLQLSKAGATELRFKVQLKYDVIDTSSGTARMPVGISIVAVTDYKWF